jgi:hypothetical protein
MKRFSLALTLLLASLFALPSFAAFRGSAGQANATASTTVTVTVSSIGIQNGDIVLFFMNANTASGTLTQPTGFSAVPGISQNIISNTVSMVWYKVAGASEPSTYTATSSASDIHTGEVRVYSGRNTASPFTAVATTAEAFLTSPGSIALTGVTAALGDDVVWLVGNASGSGVATPALTNPSGFANQNIFYDATAFSPPILSCDSVNVSAGATGTLTGTETWSPLAAYGGYVLSLAKAAASVNGVVMSNGHPIRSGNSILVR